ncbi:MAG: hypothetical protein D6702_02380 [Planctomycetota bacterium]|nr:MAG: hypothetical protein D6702_02380 [Planctomycetota bacterium]
MQRPPFPVRHELAGWQLFWAGLESSRPVAPAAVARLRAEAAAALRARLAPAELTAQPAVAALRRLFRAAGTDPTRYRPASEALARRVLKGGELPAIHPLVDLNNALSLALLCPCCVMRAGSFSPPFTWRAGRAGESYESLRGGDFGLAGRPLLVDEIGPADTPITGTTRVGIEPETTAATLVAYLPDGVVEPADAEAALTDLAGRAGIDVGWTGLSRG